MNENEGPQEYKVTEARLPVVRERFAKLAKKAAKLNVPAATFTVVRESKQHFCYDARDGHKRIANLLDSGSWTERVYYVTVEGEAPRLPGGWKLAATIQHTEVGNAVRAAAEFDATQYRTGTPKCDHCQTARNRRDTYVVVNDEGVTKQVGTNCIADFLGGVNPEAIANYAGEWIDSLNDLENEFEGHLGTRNRESVYLAEYLAEVVAAVEAHGWLPKSRATEYQTPTASRATDNLFALCQIFPACWKHETSHRDAPIPTEEQRQEADVTLTWCRDHFQDRNDLNDYEWNLSVALLRDWIEPRETGLAASAVAYYRRAIEKEIQQAERAKQREAAGPAPEGRVQVAGIVTKVQEREGYMLDTVTYKMTVLLENGSRVWTTVPSAISDVEPGDRIQFTATFEHSADDATFAFGKRPSKASITERKEAQA